MFPHYISRFSSRYKAPGFIAVESVEDLSSEVLTFVELDRWGGDRDTESG